MALASELTSTKDTTLEVATEIPPTPPTTWGAVSGVADIYDISGMPLVYDDVETTTLGPSRFREYRKTLYGKITITLSMFFTAGEFDVWFTDMAVEPGLNWYKMIFGSGANFVFPAFIGQQEVVSGPPDDVVRVNANLVVVSDVTYSLT